VSVCGWDRIGWLTCLYCREQLAALEGCKAELAQLTWSTAENISPWRRSRLSSPCRAAPEHVPAARRGSWETLTLHTQSGCRSNSSDGSHRRRRDRSSKYCRMRRKCRPTLRSATYSEQKPSRTAREAAFSWSILHQWLLTIRKLKKALCILLIGLYDLVECQNISPANIPWVYRPSKSWPLTAESCLTTA